MLRAGVRSLQNGPTTKLMARYPLSQLQRRTSSQAVAVADNVASPGLPPDRINPGRRKLPSRPNDEIFQLHAKKSGRPAQKPVKQPKSFRQPKASAVVSSDHILYTRDYIRKEMQIPTREDYEGGVRTDSAKSIEKLLEESELQILKHATQLPKKHRYSASHQMQFKMKFPGGNTVNILGHGVSIKEARDAACLHAICYLHQTNLLKDFLPGGVHHVPPPVNMAELKREGDAKREVIDLAARYDCLPVFTFKKGASTRHPVQAHVSIPELNLDGRGSAKQVDLAILAACIRLKQAAEARYQETGAGILLLKDYTVLNTESAEKFVDFYCSQKGYRHIYSEESFSANKHGAQRKGFVTLSEERATISDEGIKIEGIAMVAKVDAQAVAYLAAALELKERSPDIWLTFVKEMKRGKGEILKPLPPIDIDLDNNIADILEDTARLVAAAEENNALRSGSEEQPARQYSRPTRRPLNDDEIQMKSEDLHRRLAQFEADPRLEELREKRSQLPMVQHGDQVMKMINESDVCVVVGATGSGKTTQVPQLVLDELIKEGKGGACNIICTQPRRIAAISVAQRVAAERDEPLQKTVGYSVRFDAKRPQMGGSIHYCTTGILLKQLQDSQDQTLQGVSHIIVDEVHERDLNIDFLLVTLRQLMADRRATGKAPIKIILMSATIDTTLFCKYFGQGFESGMCPYIEVPGRTFPVTSHHVEEIYDELKNTYPRDQALELFSKDSQKYIDEERSLDYILPTTPFTSDASKPEAAEETEPKAVIDWKSRGAVGDDGEVITIDKEESITPVGIMCITIAHLLKTTSEGSILVFLPGLQEIVALERLLKSARPLGLLFETHPNYKLYTLHSSIPQMQKDVFNKLGPGERKIILATNIAETSITIPDVVYVVDSAKHRETQYDPTSNVSRLLSTWTAKSNAKQRAGRAGRVQNGHYYTMASIARHESFDVSQKAEILRTDLQDVCLQIKSMGIQDIRGFLQQAIQPPDSSSVSLAIEQLQELGAFNEKEELLPLGRLLSNLPLSPQLGKMVVLGAIFKCLDPILIVAAAASAKTPFIVPRDRRDEAENSKLEWAGGVGSDYAALINAFRTWREREMRIRNDMRWASDNFLHYSTLKHISNIAEQILEVLEKSGIIQSSPPAIRGLRLFFGSAADNVNSASVPLQTALITAGLYPNIAVRSRINPARFLRTSHENKAEIGIQSIVAPRPASGKRYGAISYREAAPEGTIFVFSEKAQGDGSDISLRTVAKTSHLATVLFSGGLSTKDNLLVVDDWIPFYLPRGFGPQPVMTMKAKLDEFLSRTFLRLGLANQRRILGVSDERSFLDEDRARDPLIQGITDALEMASKEYPRLLPNEVYGGIQSNSQRGSSYSARRRGLEEWESSLYDESDTFKEDPRSQALQYQQLQQHRSDQRLDGFLSGQRNKAINDLYPWGDLAMNGAKGSKSSAMNSSSWRNRDDGISNLRNAGARAMESPSSRSVSGPNSRPASRGPDRSDWRGRPDAEYQNKHQMILDELYKGERKDRSGGRSGASSRLRDKLLRDDSWDFI